MAKYCIGVDLGGSSIKCGTLDADRKAGRPIELPTPQGGAQAVVDQLIAAAREVMERDGLRREDIVGVGLGSPGPLKISEGIIVATPNIPGLVNVPARALLAEALGVPAVLENDANAAALGECLCGAGKGHRDMVLLTLGTGVGGGIVIDGRILHGAHEIGAELGHTLVHPGGEPCNCGQRGCLERYASATFMAQRALREVERHGGDGVLSATLRRKGTITSRDVLEAHKAGDPLASKMWDEAARYLAIACVTFARVLDPEVILLGGGMANAGEDLLKPVRMHYHRMHWTITEPLTGIDLASLGNDAGFIGAAGAAWQSLGGGEPRK